MTGTPVDLDAIKARMDAATAEPWGVDLNMPFSHEIVGVFAESQRRYVFQQDVNGYEVGIREADAEFIAAARSDVPALVAEVERLRAALGVAEKMCECGKPLLHLDADPDSSEWACRVPPAGGNELLTTPDERCSRCNIEVPKL